MKAHFIVLFCIIIADTPLSHAQESDDPAFDIYEIGFTLLNNLSPERSDSLAREISFASGVVSVSVDPSDSTCIVRLTHMERLDTVIQILDQLKIGFDPVITVRNSNLNCTDWNDDTGRSPENIPMTGLAESLDSFILLFNSLADKTRVVSLPNPACKACVNGQRLINELFTNHWTAETNVVGLFVFLSLDGWGTISDARHLASEYLDPRVSYFWDADQRLGKAFKKPLGLRDAYCGAWDAYLVFGPGILWTEETPPAPSFWMHQMYPRDSGAPKNRMLNKEVLLEEMSALLKQASSRY